MERLGVKLAKLTELEPRFIRYVERDGRIYFEEVVTLAQAQGVRFLCPKCFVANRGPIGTHVVVCWSRSRGAPDMAQPGPGRWKLDGTGFADLTLNADPPGKMRSVKLAGGCGWHGHVTHGDVT